MKVMQELGEIQIAIYITGFGKLTIDDNTHGVYIITIAIWYIHWADARTKSVKVIHTYEDLESDLFQYTEITSRKQGS